MRVRSMAVLAFCALAPSVGAADPSPREALAQVALTTPAGAPFPSPRQPVLVVTTWATGCGGCKTQLDNVQALANALSGDPDVAFLAINVDPFLGTSRADQEKGRKGLKLTLPLAQDKEARFIRTLEAWSAQGPSASPTLPMTVTLPAIYVVDAGGHTHGELKLFRDTKPTEFIDRYRPIIEQARKGALASAGGSAEVATTVAQDQRDVAVSRGKVRLKYPAMTDAQIQRTLPDVRKQLAQMFPKANAAKLDQMVARVAEAMKKGEPVEFDSQ